MKSGLVFVLVVVTLTVSQAQSRKIQFGFTAAMNVNPYLNPQRNEYITPNVSPGFSFGVMARKSFSDNLSLDFGTQFTKIIYKGVQDKNIYRPVNPDDPLTNVDWSYTFTYSYIEVPIELNFRVSERSNFDWVASGGIINSFGVRMKSDWAGSENANPTSNDVYLTNLKAGFGLLFHREKVSFGVEPQLRYALLRDFKYAESENLYIGLEASILLHGKGSN